MIRLIISERIPCYRKGKNSDSSVPVCQNGEFPPGSEFNVGDPVVLFHENGGTEVFRPIFGFINRNYMQHYIRESDFQTN